jgi:hypothetical protein
MNLITNFMKSLVMFNYKKKKEKNVLLVCFINKALKNLFV